MNRVKILLAEVKPKHGIDYGFIVVGILGLVLALVQKENLYYFLVAVGLGFGVLMYFSIKKQIDSFNIIESNYQSNKDVALSELAKVMNKLQKGIEVDQRKAAGGGRDAADSAGDVVRKQAKMDIYLELKEEINKL